jgi:hypothetical protein
VEEQSVTSKERVEAVLMGQLPDKVPWGEWAVDFDTVERIVGHETFYRAKAKSQIAFWEGRRDEVVQSWIEDGIDFYRKMDCFDIINIGAPASGIAPPRGYIPEKPKKIDETTWEFSDGTVMKYSDITADLTIVYDPNAGTVQYAPGDFDKEPEIEIPDESCFEVIDAYIEEFGGERFLLGPAGDEVGIYILGGNFELGGGGFAYGLMQYIDNPQTVKAAIRYETRKNNTLDKYYIRNGQDAVAWGQDFASSQGTFISPAMFREFALPAIKARVKNIHDEFGIPVIKHACGNNNKILDMFVEAGYDVYQSIQASAGMRLGEIKARYGRHFACMGGIRVETLVSGTPEEIEKEVQHAMSYFKEGGRWIFGSSHSIAVGTKYENFLAMADQFVKCRDY